MKVVLSDLVFHANKNSLEPPGKKPRAISVTVSCIIANRELASASAERLSRRGWNISRVFVPIGYRCQGVGGALLGKLKEELASEDQFKVLTVAAGGYNSDLSRLEKFYTRYGFRKKEENYYVWRKPTQPATGESSGAGLDPGGHEVQPAALLPPGGDDGLSPVPGGQRLSHPDHQTV